MRNIAELRLELDALDRQLIDLLRQRMRLSQEIARWKKAQGMPVLDSTREQQVIASRIAMAQGALKAEDVQALFERIMSMSRDCQSAWMEENPDA